MSRYYRPGQLSGGLRASDFSGCLMPLLAVIGFFALAALATVGCGSLTSQQKAERALTNLGFSNVRFDHRDVLFIEFKGCGQEDNALYYFTATNAVGKPVKVSVCEGVLKGATIRGTE